MSKDDILFKINAWMKSYELGGKIEKEDFADLYKDFVNIRDFIMGDATNKKSLIANISAVKYEDYVYAIVKLDCDGMDSIYGDYIERIVGTSGLNALIKNDMVESCGVVNGRQLYVLK